MLNQGGKVAGISLIANRDSITLYRTFSYRDGGKNPRNTRKTIGKVVEGTNRIVINDYFLQLMIRQGLEPEDLRGKSLSEISRMVDFKVDLDSGDFQARRLHHDSQIEIDDPRLKRLGGGEPRRRRESAARKTGSRKTGSRKADSITAGARKIDSRKSSPEISSPSDASIAQLGRKAAESGEKAKSASRLGARALEAQILEAQNGRAQAKNAQEAQGQRPRGLPSKGALAKGLPAESLPAGSAAAESSPAMPFETQALLGKRLPYADLEALIQEAQELEANADHARDLQHQDYQTRDQLNKNLLEFVKERIKDKNSFHGYVSRPLAVKSLGAQLVLERAAESSGLRRMLAKIFPDIWAEILTLAFHLVTGGNLADCASRLARVGGLIGAESLDSERLEEILASMDQSRRLRFHESWEKSLSESSTTAFDIPSVSSAIPATGNVFLDRALSGREAGRLNMAVLWSDSSELPIRLKTYPGPPSEAEALLDALEGIASAKPRLVLGQRFYDDDNMATLLRRVEKEGFILRMPVDVKRAQCFIEQFVGNIFVINNNLNDKTLFAYCVDYKDFFQRPLKIHVFLDERANLAAEKAVYQNLFRLKRDLESDPERLSDLGRYKDFFRLDPDAPNGPLMVKHKEAADRYRGRGWLLALPDLESPPASILGAFEAKEDLDANFKVIRSGLSLTGFGPEDRPLNDRKAFLGLVALILMSQARKTHRIHNLDKTMTVPGLLKDIDDIVAVIDGRRVIYSKLTETQRLILEAFGANANYGDEMA